MPQPSRRSEGRVLLAVPLVIFGLALDDRAFYDLTASHDVSCSGCRFHLSVQPQSDAPLAIRVVSDELGRHESARILFDVIWLRPEGNGWAVGARRSGDCDFRALASSVSA